MDVDAERVLKLIFPEGLPDDLRDNKDDVITYLNKLGQCTVDELKKERARLAEESANVIEQIKELTVTNFQAIITTTEKSRTISKEFVNANKQVDELIEKLPQLDTVCDEFLKKKSPEIMEAKQINATTLKKHTEIMEILEVPQLMELCLQDGCYEEALELASYVQKMNDNHGDIKVVKSIVEAVEGLWQKMLIQLIDQLRMDLQLPKCLQIVSYLKRMQAFDANELKLKFLQARNTWLQNTLKAIPTENVQQHLTKTIEVTRVNLFSIVTQYKAIFPDEDDNENCITNNLTTQLKIDMKSQPLHDVSCQGDRLFQSWLHEKITEFLKTLEDDLERGVFSYDTILGQCMYFGLSFSRVGADFRALMVPIFIKVIKKNFLKSINTTNELFNKEMDKYTLINKVIVHGHRLTPADDSYSPPETLLDFHPLAVLCNGYLNALNDLRLCAPLALAHVVTDSIQQSLEMVSQRLLSFYRQEHQAYTSNETDMFHKLCNCFIHDFLPYIQKCIHGMFKPSVLCNHLGINQRILEDDIKITYIQRDPILSHIKSILVI